MFLGIIALLLVAILFNMVSPGTGIGSLFGYGRELTWLMTFAIFVGIIGLCGWGIRGRLDGIFIDKDNRISLPNFQLVLWSVLLISAIFSAGLSNAAIADNSRPALEIEIPPQIWALLGLGALTAVAVPALKDVKRSAAISSAIGLQQTGIANEVQISQGLSQAPAFEGRVLRKAADSDARWIDIVSGDFEGSNYVDVSKLQQLAFTILLFFVYARDIWSLMGGINPIMEFPSVSDGFLAFLTISHAAYLADTQLADT